MAKVYARKIKDCDINPSTGNPWCTDDVPVRWREEVRKLLDEGGSERV